MQFQIGDEVIITRDWTDEEEDRYRCGHFNLLEYVDITKTYIIKNVLDRGNYQLSCGWWLPECVLAYPGYTYPPIPQTLFSHECIHCGEDIPLESPNNVCETCQEDYYTCAGCGKSLYIDDLTNGPDGELYCEECYNNLFIECYNCSAVVSRDDACSNDMDNHLYCSDCYSDMFTYCDDCGCDLYRDDAYNTDDGTYCESCYNDRTPRLLHEYGYSPELTFLDINSKEYNDSNDTLYMGIELEVDNGNDANSFLENNESFFEDLPVYFCHDGSLNEEGIEMITHPCTLEYHISKIPYHEIFKTFASEDYRSHDTDTCGLHCHINRSYLGKTYDECDINIAKILIFYERSWDKIIKFSRRTPSQYNHWCKRYAMSTDNDDQIKELLETAKSADRYYAVNLSNYTTIEFRVFRGTLNINTFMATLQFVESVIQFIKTIPINNHHRINWDEYKTYISNESEKYLKLINYLNSKEL
jgi:hypothetical protein